MGIEDWLRSRKNSDASSSRRGWGGAKLIVDYKGEIGERQIGFSDESTLDLFKQRERAYQELFGEPDIVFHELIPFIPHVDVYRFPPSENRNYFTFVTAGMSTVPMTVPASVGRECRRVELAFYAAESKKEYAAMLGELAHYPHDYKTWLHWGHTMPNGNPPELIFGSEALDHFFFAPSMVKADDELGRRLEWEGDPINLLWCIPISSAECQFKLKCGADALCKLLAANEHSLLFSGGRGSYV